MTTSLPVQYRAAELTLASARTAAERQAALAEMLAAIVGHAGTARRQAEIKRRLERLRQDAVRKSGKRSATVHVEPEGSARVALLGPPNSGKSSLLAVLTRAEPVIADYPFSTSSPHAGMTRIQDVPVQLIDLPPITAGHLDPWMPELLRTVDAALLVADASTPGVLTGIEELCERLTEIRVPLVGTLPEDSEPAAMPLPTVLVASKTDLVREDDLQVLEELYGPAFEVVRFSATAHRGVQGLKIALWRALQMVRVYLKGSAAPEPVVLPLGYTVFDLAGRILGADAGTLAAARVWGGAVQGQRVGRDFALRDGDQVELLR